MSPMPLLKNHHQHKTSSLVQIKQWWASKNQPPTLHGHVIPVKTAMQGHSESPRLWEQHIDWILQELGLTLTTHKPCLYSGLIHGQRVLFMRQVDDFAVTAPSESISNILFDMIDDRPKHHSSWLSNHDIPNRPTPHPSTKTCMTSFLNSMKDSDPQIQGEIKKSMKISYRSAIDKLIYAMTTCRPNIAYATVRAS